MPNSLSYSLLIQQMTLDVRQVLLKYRRLLPASFAGAGLCLMDREHGALAVATHGQDYPANSGVLMALAMVEAALQTEGDRQVREALKGAAGLLRSAAEIAADKSFNLRSLH